MRTSTNKQLVLLFQNKILPILKERKSIHYTELSVLINKSTSYTAQLCRRLAIMYENLSYENGTLKLKEEGDESHE